MAKRYLLFVDFICAVPFVEDDRRSLAVEGEVLAGVDGQYVELEGFTRCGLCSRPGYVVKNAEEHGEDG